MYIDKKELREECRSFTRRITARAKNVNTLCASFGSFLRLSNHGRLSSSMLELMFSRKRFFRL